VIKFTTFLGASAIALCLSSVVAGAATLIVSDGTLTGATGVDVQGTLYDVEFRDGNCAALFDGCNEDSDFDFQDYATANAAGQALMDTVFFDGLQGNFDSDPWTIRGCSSDDSNERCNVYTPYDYELYEGVDFFDQPVVLDQISFATVVNLEFSEISSGDFLSSSTQFWQTTDFTLINNAGNDNRTFALWSAQAASVPLPAGVWLLLTGVLGMVGLRRRARRTA
jgi:hypothetical protein|tara:strand:- start:328 stop:999 length:672 start_codon:yes stop_codon:yes gene_type:complete